MKKPKFNRLRVTVTETEINEATRAKSNKCMIHEAIKREYPQLKNILVDKNHVRLTDPETNSIYTYQMTPLGRVALLKFDGGEDVKPFSFTLQSPVIRERVTKDGASKPKSREQRSSEHLGPIPTPLTKEGRRQVGRDRVFGQKLWTTELQKVRDLLETKPAKAE